MIQLTENLAVIADDLQYILGKPVQRERNGSTVTEIRRPRYYPTLEGAVRGAVVQTVRDRVQSEEIRPYGISFGSINTLPMNSKSY